MKYLIFVLLSGCTYSVTNIQTRGVASDLVDEEQEATADVKPVLHIPLVK